MQSSGDRDRLTVNQRTANHSAPARLDYFVPAPAERPAHSFWWTACSFACPGVPILGLALRNGMMFIAGGLFAPLCGMFAAISALVAARGRPLARSVGAIALAFNVLAAAFFFNWIFIHGLC